MRLSLAWLAEFIDLPPDAELVEQLNLGGFEDAEIEVSGPDLSGVVVGHVVEHGAHPDADRLSLCRVDSGDETFDVVCGAPNVAAGQKIAYAPVGTTLPDGRKLKKAKIRGVVSYGMICSRAELGLGEEDGGIVVLPEDAPVGAPLADAIAAGDRTLVVGLTPNRGDAASLLGIAREVRALVGGEVRIPDTAPDESGAQASDAVSVFLDAAAECHHYVARVVRGVRVEPSPPWLAERLEASGIRAINNVVDITNLVLLEFGQPLHAFDLGELRGARVGVRAARAGEKLACLDGETRELTPEDLVISDAERAIALAGVMGGADTEVGDTTTDVLIESAHFRPTVVRLGARRHGLQTEASYRFERGVDRGGIARAADRAARLMAEICGGHVGAGTAEARGDAAPHCEEIAFDVSRANRLLGTEIPVAEARALLLRLGLEGEETGEGVLRCRVPSHRNDLHIQQDVTEELARIYGYDQIPTSVPFAALEPVAQPVTWRLAERAKDALAADGCIEVVNLPFVPPGDADALGLGAEDPRRQQRRVVNPIKEEEPLLRTSLLPSLIRLAVQNRSHQLDSVSIFEVARVFRSAGPQAAPDEPLWLAALWTEPREPALWRPANPAPLFFQAKGLTERLLIQLGYMASLQRSADTPVLHPGSSVAIEVAQREVGMVGELHPEVAANFGLDVPCAVMEIDLRALAAVPSPLPQFREVSRQPRVQRDLAVVVASDQKAGEILAAIRKAGGQELVAAELFDRYEGKGVPDGKVSLAYRLVFQRADRTLTEKEVTKATDRVVKMLSHRFGGELR